MREIVKVISASISKWSAVHRFKAKRFDTLSSFLKDSKYCRLVICVNGK